MAEKYIVILPWPLVALNPNNKPHWAVLARCKKEYRQACWALAKEAGWNASTLTGVKKVGVHLDFYPPNRRDRDEDNLIASMKAGLDGLADALQFNDSGFRLTHDLKLEVRGLVKVTLTPFEVRA
ncbi:MAG: endonuclease [Burkholderiaceae bacterium]